MPADATLAEALRTLPVFPADLPAFDPDTAPDDPVGLFRAWLDDAIRRDVPTPHAMTLSTVDPAGKPAARVLILKDVDAAGWRFATHANSPKGRHIAGNGHVALTFFWPQVGRQVRIQGRATPENAATSARDFLARPVDSRTASLVGRQSEPLSGPAEYERAFAAARERVTADPDLVAPSWTVYAVRPESVEFWQASHDRAHIRLHYAATANGWETQRRWP
ncbi:MAG TPA: pyridoxal 5'-phosphate synthase [Jiangellaceae bacterium]|nr:pyridoxal 5'-phosphate synthase [Jiangellaceae bacterium]